VRFASAKFGGDDLHSIAANIEAMHPEIERYASLIDTQCTLLKHLTWLSILLIRPILDAIKMGASLDSFSQGNGQNLSIKLFELLICCRAAKIGPASQRLEADNV
jgi:hypothetical protein